MRNIIHFVFSYAFPVFSVFLIFSAPAASEKISSQMTQTIHPKIYEFKVIQNDLEKYHKFLGGRDPLKITDTQHKNFWRHPLELFMFQIAPVIGGCNCKIVYKGFTSRTTHARAITNVRSGRWIAHPIAGFPNDNRLNKDLYHSEPILRPEEFFVGLYTHSKREDILALKEIKKIKKLRFITVGTWKVDRQLIRNMGFKLVTADHWHNLLKMIQANRADIVLQPFSSRKNFAFEAGNPSQTFVPIRNIKISFGQGRIYFVSRKHPEGKKFLTHLNRGLRILRKNGFLRKANENAGVINPKIHNWSVIK